MAPANLPKLGLELARLMREAKVHETMVTLLTQQLEQARLAEARDLPVVQVIDSGCAASPAVETAARLTVNLAIAFVASLFVGILLAAVVDLKCGAR